MLNAGGPTHPVGVNHLVIAQIDSYVGNYTISSVENQVTALACRERHMLELRVFVKLLRSTVARPTMLDHIDRLRIHTGVVKRLQSKT